MYYDEVITKEVSLAKELLDAKKTFLATKYILGIPEKHCEQFEMKTIDSVKIKVDEALKS